MYDVTATLNSPIEKMTKKEIALDNAGATRKAAYEAMVAALDANSMVVDKYGAEHESPDHSTRIRAAELISKLHGDLKENVVDNRVVNIAMSVTSDELATFMEMVSDVQAQLRNLPSSGRQTGEIIDVAVV